MLALWRKKDRVEPATCVEAIRARYHNFRDLLSLNNECLEVMAGLQEDLQFVPPRDDVVQTRVSGIFDRAASIADNLGKMTGVPQHALKGALDVQCHEVERYLAERRELATPRFAIALSETGIQDAAQVGGKAAALAEIRNRLGLPVPEGYVVTTDAYRSFCGIPLWTVIRDTVRNLDPNDLDAVAAASNRLQELVLEQQMPRAIEVAVTERARVLDPAGRGLAVRSSAVGEGGERTYAGQFRSLINVPVEQALDAYKRVIAGRFRERALVYRLSTGLLEVESPMAVLFLAVVHARAAGILYTRDPGNPKSEGMWITATRGLGLDIASGRAPADLFIVSRSRSHAVIEQHITQKQEEVVADASGGVTRQAVLPASAGEPSVKGNELQTLAEWSLRIEEHFRGPQDIEWALDHEGRIWILQARPLAVTESGRFKQRGRPRTEPLLSGGRTIYPGQVSGVAFLVDDAQSIRRTPNGAIMFVRRASPELVQVFPRIGGLVAEWGNVAGHAAALLREFKIPSVFLMQGAFERIRGQEPVSLDAVQAKVYAGAIWPPRAVASARGEPRRERNSDPIDWRLLALNLLDPTASNFRPSGCESVHDVIRYCHEKAIEAMFAASDVALEQGPHGSKRLVSDLPVNLHVLDLGGGLALDDPTARQVKPEQITSRPFQALWKGISHPAVTWTREMPASLSDLASVMANSFAPQGGSIRALGDRSYLLVADEYMNLNSRLAYHFSLVDACVTDAAGKNYIAFRFEGGGATRQRRSLRACFIEACLTHYGFQVDRRGDLVNAWLKKAPAAQTEEKLDIVGRLLGCASQLDMYMTSHQAMLWYVRQFLEGNYAFRDG